MKAGNTKAFRIPGFFSSDSEIDITLKYLDEWGLVHTEYATCVAKDILPGPPGQCGGITCADDQICYNDECVPLCSDSDDGLDVYHKGTISIFYIEEGQDPEPRQLTDLCDDRIENRLGEYTCIPNYPCNPYHFHICTFGCENGACKFDPAIGDCTPDIQCTEWSECAMTVPGVPRTYMRKRTCTDLNDCGIDVSDLEYMSCNPDCPISRLP